MLEPLDKFCEFDNDGPVKCINGMDQFDYISKFGGNYSTTKNVHGTFSYKMRFHNKILWSNYPLTLEELSNLEVEFENRNNIIIHTKYMIIVYHKK